MINNSPLISIIVPVYNVENYICQCVDSLINQSLNNIEIILVDDGSTDKSGNICDEYSSKYSNVEVIHKINGGLGSARNEGLKYARGLYVGFVDSDDYVSEKMYETLWKLVKGNDADCAYCEEVRFWGDEANIISIKNKEINIYSNDEILNTYLLDRIGCIPSEKEDCLYGASVCLGLFKTELIKNNNINFVSERELISEDMIFDLDFIPHCKKIVHTNEILQFYRFNPNSLTTKYVSDRFERNVSLCKEMDCRLNRIYNSDIYKIRLDRYFLKITRIALIEEVIHIKDNGWKVAKDNIKRIANNEELNRILDTYPISSLPKIQKIFFNVLKQKKYLLIIMLIKGHLILKKVNE